MPTPAPPSRRRSPRPWPRLGAVLLAAALLAGSSACVRGENAGSGTTPPSSGGTAPTGPTLPDCPLAALDEATGVVQVELWHALVGESQIALDELAAAFNAEQDKVRVVVRSQGTDYDEVLRKYVAAIPSRQLPAIAYLEDTTLREIVDSGTLLPAEACERADGFSTGQLPSVRNYYTADGVYWPAYTNVSEPILYYNMNHFRRAGLDPAAPPQTLAELEEMARTIKAEVPEIDAPLALILNEWFVESWIVGAGESVVSHDNGRSGLADQSTFDNPVTRELYTWIKQMADEGLLQGFPGTDGQLDHYFAVGRQNATMAIETSTAATTIKTVLGGTSFGNAGIDPGDLDLSAIDVMAGPFPGLREPAQVRISGAAFYITNTVSPAEQAAAWAFMKYMWTDGQVPWHIRGSYLPTTQTAAADPEVVDYWDDDLAGRMLKVGYDQLVRVDPQRPGPQIGPYFDYTAAIRNSLDRLVLEGASVDAVVTAADREIQAALDRYIEDNG